MSSKNAYMHVTGTVKTTHNRAQIISEFLRLTGIPESRAIVHLEECGWDICAALKKCEIENLHDVITPSTSQDKVSSCSEWAGRELPGYAFCLPDLDRLAPDFRNFLERDLIESPTQRRLENSRHLNWWSPYGQKLYPLSTTGDGNCLLHAASLGMWGLHDRQLTLREALYEMIIRGSRRTALWRRWKWSEQRSYQAIGLNLTDEEWMNEWDNNIVALASPQPRKTDDCSSDSTDQIYESLEAIHVFALAHVLKRPIVVVSDTVLRNAKGEELSPVPFGGVYLPLECRPEHCHRSPLVLCYDSAHFSPLVPMRHDSSQPQIIPVTDFNRNLLPLHFAVDPGEEFQWLAHGDNNLRHERSDSEKISLMSDYMDLVRLDVRRGSIRKSRPIRNSSSSAEKSMTLASSGVATDSRDKNRILNEIRQQFKRTLRLSSSKSKDSGIDAKLCAADISRTSCVIAAFLVSSQHEYMEEMVREYMKSARERFKETNTNGNNNNNTQTPNSRKRISRSFSASSLMITCINLHCEKPATQSSNFLCRDCFEHQKEVMTSFHRESHLRKPSAKSNTMPIISSDFDGTSSIGSKTSANTPRHSVTKCAPVLAVKTSEMMVTNSVSSVTSDNGVTHYFVDDSSAINGCLSVLSSISSPSRLSVSQLAS